MRPKIFAMLVTAAAFPIAVKSMERHGSKVAMRQLADSALEARRQHAHVDVSEPIAHRALLSLAVNARTKG